jgi:hypothetical protein
MPTDQDNGASPTVEGNALDIASLPIEEIEAHPHVQELKKKYAAAHTGMDQSNLSKKQLEAELAKYKMLAGEEEPPEEEERPQFVTKEELSSTLWETKHAKDIELYGDETYQKELEQGVPRDIAIRYAKMRHESSPNQAKVIRQQSVAQGSSASTRDLSDTEITDEDREDMKRWGYSEKAILRQKKQKAMRG